MVVPVPKDGKRAHRRRLGCVMYMRSSLQSSFSKVHFLDTSITYTPRCGHASTDTLCPLVEHSWSTSTLPAYLGCGTTAVCGVAPSNHQAAEWLRPHATAVMPWPTSPVTSMGSKWSYSAPRPSTPPAPVPHERTCSQHSDGQSAADVRPFHTRMLAQCLHHAQCSGEREKAGGAHGDQSTPKDDGMLEKRRRGAPGCPR